MMAMTATGSFGIPRAVSRRVEVNRFASKPHTLLTLQEVIVQGGLPPRCFFADGEHTRKHINRQNCTRTTLCG
jgi:hypothetical protein